ncbi:MAG TPA: DUF3549 domain-containing protein [Idiomarina abyssalis]|uniref:DUF3549 family protein n=2 Tax=Idiomarinaceae TaxID=267893 RepID=UPI000C42EF9E|nr:MULTISPECIES: DUF3549 family protein [Idiomarina]MAB22401.1 hypothetical protein [Idiomarina sp.]MBH95527.1 hypothetical protein [Idiomarina sp.]MDA6065798.1 DUF3549 family protein [Idiomarina abyssalis]HAS15432.1 DUF3549 domain-containing protein [Idiomarina abyssalis]
MSAPTITTLGEFLQAGQAEYKIFDIGRCLTELSQDDFAAIEHQQRPYPYPIARQAQLAILFQHKQHDQQPFIWFLQFPLDERGLLNLAARNQYLEYVVNALGHEITGEMTEEQQKQLQQNPYLLTPNEHQRAALHARVQRQLKLSPSIHFETAEAYLKHPKADIDWQQIGLQGLHDCAARLEQLPELSEAIATHFSTYPKAVRQPLAVALEQQNITPRLRDSLLEYVKSNDALLCTDSLRALASVAAHPRVQKSVNETIPDANADQLVVVAARLWPVLNNEHSLLGYLDAIASLDNALFDALFQDIIALPDIRPLLLSILAQQKQSDAVGEALNRLKQQTRSA